ncbi:hypothetical protein ID866_12445 [Astraeus odoratus]|nr:hypothetical protein ID866_12445 [Astraeus odoratus]
MARQPPKSQSPWAD